MAYLPKLQYTFSFLYLLFKIKFIFNTQLIAK
nr:MAG TPA: hypothetical protein [Caudoviricetes sp.]